jgi:DNA polymerase I
MPHIAFDTETYPLVQRGKATTKITPRLVCMSYFTEGMKAPVVLERARAVPLFRQWLEDPEVKLVGHNVTFDMLVMARALSEEYAGEDFAGEIFGVYAGRRIHDTISHIKLKRIDKTGTTKDFGYTLAFLAQRFAGIELEGKTGDDVWRYRYHELEGVVAEKYPKRAYDYAALDALATWETWVAMTQREHYQNESFQLCADLAFYLMCSWGFMVDRQHAMWIYNHYAAKAGGLAGDLRDVGIMRPDGTNDTQRLAGLFEAAWKAVGRNPMMTTTGRGVATSKEAFEALKEAGVLDAEGMDAGTVRAIRAYSEYLTANKFIATYLDPLLDAGEHPVCCRITTIVDTGRTSASGPNIQNFPAHMNADERRAQAVGFQGPFGRDIRGCIVPRKGKVFLVADYAAIELMALGQVIANIAGQVTELGRVLNAGTDPHLYLLASMWREDYESVKEAYKAKDEHTARWRQIMKAANYSFGGGAFPTTFMEFVKGYGLQISEAEAELAFQGYHNTYPDVRNYHFADIERCEVRPNVFEVELHGPNRATKGWMRRRCWKKTQALNTRFQSLVGAGAKYAAWNIQKACYTQKDSPLYDDRMVLFVHDEFVLEVADENLEEKKAEFERLMVGAMKLFIPDILVEAEVRVMTERWSK